MKKFLFLMLCNAVCCMANADSFINNDSVAVVSDEEYVDLGLSVKWATKNLGANTPFEFGNYYAWGETSPKEAYTRDNSLYKDFEKDVIVKAGVYTDDGHLIQKVDAAKKYLGEHWRIPTKDEIKELFDKCSIETAKERDVIVFKITGPNGNVIFIPSAGGKLEEKYEPGGGIFWSSDLPDDGLRAFAGFMTEDGNAGIQKPYRYWGASIRPVWDE